MDAEALELLRRHSGLRLTAEGRFTFRGNVVPNPRVQSLFHQGLEVREDGDVTLTVGSQWAYVTCETVARFVDHVDISRGDLVITTRCSGREVCEEPAVGYGPDDRFYVWSSPDAFPAVLTRVAHQQLAGILSSPEEGPPGVPLGDHRLEIVTLDQAPGPHERRGRP